MQLSVKAYAKINWALDVLGRLDDGYHDLDMWMSTLELSDELSFAPSGVVSLTVNGKLLPNGGRNLIIRAANALKEYTGCRTGARINLVKRIPVRAGLGGGSADCAATLAALNSMWKLNLSTGTLMEIGASLGADVPFCLLGGFARVMGKGDRIEPRRAPDSRPLVLLHPGGGLSTAEVFSRFDEGDYQSLHIPMDAVYDCLISGDDEGLKRVCANALEPVAEKLKPEVGQAKADLYRLGATFAQMSGSGTAVFGVFRTMAKAEAAAAKLGPRAILTATR